MATIRWWKLAVLASIVAHGCGQLSAQQQTQSPVAQQMTAKSAQRSKRFLAQRSLDRTYGNKFSPSDLMQKARAQHESLKSAAAPDDTTPLSAPWTPIGPSSVETSSFGLISGRITSIAVDPSDSSGNTVYVGTTGGGVWKSTNAASDQTSSVTFTPLTDVLPVSSNCSTQPLSSLSIGALTVQPGATGVILAGTGDPNDSLDSYYGSGILRSTDRGNTWCLITDTVDGFHGALRGFSFRGLGFAGFSWSTADPQLVVAAVANSKEGDAVLATGTSSFAGLYYSKDAGQTWYVAAIRDDPSDDSKIIQSAQKSPTSDPGNSATSVTWNPIRKRFYAAVRYHGYYESPDGITWNRLASQPGVNPAKCPTNPNGIGSSQCPIFRGTITAQPVTGDLFAITVDNDNKDQGLWRDDSCSSVTNCSADSAPLNFEQIADTAIEDSSGRLLQGDYDLSLAAVPAQGDTLLFVGTRDIFSCSVLNSCVWRNTTTVDNPACTQAKVAPSQHVIDATAAAKQLIYFGNDGGLWRKKHADHQTPSCSTTDAGYFDNLNGGLGSLAEIGNFSQNPQDQNVFMAAMGAFGTAAPQSASGTWTQIRDGEGDINAIDPANPQNWYATSAAPIDINLCPLGTACNQQGFGSPVIDNTQVGNDGEGLTGFASWILDPQNTGNMVVGTCRVWRGPADGTAWNANNAISLALDTAQNAACNGNGQIRSLAASGTSHDPAGTAEKIYAGMAGKSDGGAAVAGHLYVASVNDTATASTTAWSDLSKSSVINQPSSIFNNAGFAISSIYVDPHDSTGNTIYVTVQGFITANVNSFLVYRSTDGGASWNQIAANLPDAPMNSIVVDPNDANTVYVALDTGVYVTRSITDCPNPAQNCWSVFGTGLPGAPVTQLQVFNSSGTSLLRASTYGRGLWQIPLVTGGVAPTSATLNPDTLAFPGQAVNSLSNASTITLTNNGTATLTITSVRIDPNFAQQNNCTEALPPGAECTFQVSFAPTATGELDGLLTVFGNLTGGQVTASLSGTGLPAGNIVLLPTSMDFGSALIGNSTRAQNITISNTGGVPVNVQTPVITGDFQISANTCGVSLAPNSGCTVSVVFKPTVAGTRTGIFSVTDDEGTQIAQLSGNGQAPATAILSGTSLNFSQPQTVATQSAPQQVMLTNNGDASLTDIVIAVSGDFTAQNSCGAFLVGHASCAISVVFIPTKVGPETGVLTVSTELGTQTVALSGTGIAPSALSALPAPLNFGDEGINKTSSPQRIVLTNNGGSPLTGLTFAVNGDYAIAANNCPSGQPLNVQSACDIDLTFTPAQTGQRNGSLTVSATNLSTSLTIPLSGSGEDFQLIVSGSSSAVIVTGQTATYTVQALSVSGSSATLTMACTGAPANATCSVSPSTVPVTALSTGSATVTVTTGVASTSSGVALIDRWRKAGIALAALLPCALLGLRRRRIQMSGWLTCLFAVALGVVLLIPTACSTKASGGGETSPTSPQGPATPSGIYTLNITGTIPGLEKSVPVTLTIQ